MLSEHGHLTFVPGEPGRLARLAVWPSTEAAPGSLEALAVAVPSGDDVIRRRVQATMVPLWDVLDELVAVPIDAPLPRSVRAWAEVARVGLRLVADGRIQPAAQSGFDAWVLGPLTAHDREVRHALASWLPPEAHCIPVPGSKPQLIRSPLDSVTGFWNAIADVMPRTSSAGVASGLWAWAGRDLTGVDQVERFMPEIDDGDRAIVGLRVQVPEADDERFAIELQLTSSHDRNRVVDAEALWRGEAAGFGADAEGDLLVALRRGARRWAPLARLLDEPTPSRLELEDNEAVELFGAAADALSSVGFEVLLPEALNASLESVAFVDQAQAQSEPFASDGSPSRFDLSTVCRLTWSATLDGEPLTEAELSQLALAKRPLVQLRGEWVVADPRVLSRVNETSEVTAGAAVAASLAGSLDLEGDSVAVELGGRVADLVDRLRSVDAPRELPEPPGLDADLRPYQRRGLAWLKEMSSLGLGGVLADDMGLGKTIQVIALHLERMAEGERAPTLVVCPASVVGIWEHEFSRFAASIDVHRYHGADRSLDDVVDGGVVVTTYGILRRDVDELGAMRWGLLVADEAQAVKNPETVNAKALRLIDAPARLALTGTPVENRLVDLWSLLDWTTPGLLGPVETFRRNIALPIERDRDEAATRWLGRAVSPFLLRRRKTDPEIAPELPPKTETDHFVELSSEQAALYRAVVEETMEQIRGAGGIERRGLVFKLLTALKQVCNHPAHYLGQDQPLADRSGKLAVFDDLVQAITEGNESTLVFTQYVAMGELLMARLAELGLAADFLHGSVAVNRRTEMVERFQANEFPVFVLSLKAGGIGLNLTQATHVIHYDRWWNPAVENQASDRAWRIGQDKPVQVHRLISEGTLEETIAQLLVDKAELAELVAGAGETWISELNDDELATLISLGSGGDR